MAVVGLWSIAFVAALSGILLGFHHELDMLTASLFFDEASQTFPARYDPWLSWLREISLLVLAPVVLASLAALAGKLLFPSRPILIPGKAAMFLLITLVLGPGLLVNGILKPNSGRPRPVAVTEFSGKETFRAWYDLSGPCTRNCSFVSGEASGAFWALAPAALVPAPYRYTALGVAAVYAVAVSGLRVAFGAHFLSDVIFAAVFTTLLIWLAHGFFFRWRTSEITEAQVEAGLGWAGFAVYAFIDRRLQAIRARNSVPTQSLPSSNS